MKSKKDVMTDPLLKKGHSHKIKMTKEEKICTSCDGVGIYYAECQTCQNGVVQEECPTCGGEGVIPS